MHKSFLKTAALLGALAVVSGAFGAHSLKLLLNEKYLGIFETAVRYHFYHVFALVAAGILFKEFPNSYIRWSGRLFCCGIIFFSGSLYLLTMLEAAGRHGYDWLGAVTPLGGLCLIAGWMLMFAGLSKKDQGSSLR